MPEGFATTEAVNANCPIKPLSLGLIPHADEIDELVGSE
jgi:hypothetical protein